MELSCVKGERILLTDNCSQKFAGIVKSINTELGRILLTDIVQFPGKKPITGYRNFDKDEIVDIKKCESTNCVADDTLNDNSSKSEVPDEPALQLPQVEFDGIKKLQSEFRFISNFGVNFHSAISILKGCSKIGVHGEDVSKGRQRRASVLAVSCPSNIFVFDLKALGDDVLHKGLREILESPNTTKVVHDCRMMSDCLKHKHLISLENVRDVEAEDLMIVFQERKMIRRHSRSLEYLLKVHLGVDMEGGDEDAEAWAERPLPPELLETLVSRVSFLLPLHEAIQRKYLQLLVDASSVYNHYVRNLDFFDALYGDPRKTLRQEISKLLVPQNHVRSDYKLKKTMPSDTS